MGGGRESETERKRERAYVTTVYKQSFLTESIKSSNTSARERERDRKNPETEKARQTDVAKAR